MARLRAAARCRRGSIATRLLRLLAWHLTLRFVAQEKRYRSMQEHIRRAHPEHYIAKLPATEESFMLMISSPPQERRNDQPTPSAAQSRCPPPLPSRVAARGANPSTTARSARQGQLLP